jgi:hypothetical protein
VRRLFARSNAAVVRRDSDYRALGVIALILGGVARR